ncbi:MULTISPECIES: hypothetical protein [unclassified Gilliamella]|uniref:hypothetical protein n=1 Tax=unclassified Gilliamella TaxID=2685620 RepID=UPI00132A27C8|nr:MULTISPECIES: hypothetical protein [unclassified Gilliamella]MWN32816.1 hypothetical protein [Gilliamella sp. Pra-s60]MWP30255.1 hypothetical protein [Gilliamella sp. Pra-s54]
MKLKTLFMLLCGLSLVACDNNINKDELQSTINNNQPLCYSLPKEVRRFPKDIFDDNIVEDNLNDELVDIFVDLNLLTKRKLSITKLDGSLTYATRYRLSQEGKTYFNPEKDGFCFGNIKVNDVYKTESISGRYSQRSKKSKLVYYHYSFSDIPDWAKDKRLTQYYITPSLNTERLYDAKAIHYQSSLYYSSFQIEESELIKLR